MHKTQKVTAIPWFHNKEDKEKSTEHNSAVEANTSSQAGTSSEVKISLSFEKWNVTIITRGIVLHLHLPAVFLLLLDVRAFEADRFARLNISLIQLYDRGVPALAIVVSCMTER